MSESRSGQASGLCKELWDRRLILQMIAGDIREYVEHGVDMGLPLLEQIDSLEPLGKFLHRMDVSKDASFASEEGDAALFRQVHAIVAQHVQSREWMLQDARGINEVDQKIDQMEASGADQEAVHAAYQDRDYRDDLAQMERGIAVRIEQGRAFLTQLEGLMVCLGMKLPQKGNIELM